MALPEVKDGTWNFTLDGHSTPPGGSFSVQTAFQVPAAIEIVRARGIAFTGCSSPPGTSACVRLGSRNWINEEGRMT